MTFEEILDQAIAMLQRRGRFTYRTLQRQFQLDDDALNDLKNELLYAHPEVRDDAGRGLIWTSGTGTTPSAAPAPAATPEPTPLAYTPGYLAEKILASRAVLEGERKQVTVLFADLKGSTELIEGLDPEEARTLLDPALHAMMAAVHRYEGTVNQVLGDGIMALFGAPVAHEDHAVRACYAALALQAAMRRYAEEVRRSHGLEMQARVGLNSGEVVVRSIGNDLHMDYSAIGQTTHLAARMEQLAPPGSIRLTAETLRLAEGWVQVTPLGPVPVKGLPVPVEVGELVGAGPEPLKARLIAQTQGNPFFLEECVRTLVETQVLVGAPGAYRLAQALPSIQVPATVQAVLAARIDRLPPEEKQLLQTAAVIGTEVALPLLQAVAEVPEEVLRLGLSHLQAAEFFYETRLFPDHEYTFKHALTQRVAYETLLHEQQRALHARIVEALEVLAGERVAEQVERLAHHALRGEVWDKALAYCRQAGEKAMTRPACREAVTYFEQALLAAQRLPTQRDLLTQGIDLRINLDNAFLGLGDPRRGFDSLREAAALAEELDDQQRLGRISNSIAHYVWRMGDYDAAIEYGQRALVHTTASGDIVEQARVYGLLGTVYVSLGDYRRAADVFRQSMATVAGDLRQARSSGLLLPSVRSRCWLVMCLTELGEFAEGMSCGAEAGRIAEAG